MEDNYKNKIRIETKRDSWNCQTTEAMDDSSYTLNFDLSKKNEIHHYSQKEHFEISKIAKFGRKML